MVEAQQLPPDIPWTTLETEHFRVHFPPALESLGRHAAERAEVAWSRLAGYVAEPPRGRIDVVVVDNTDISNGYATPIYSNRVVLFAPPPVSHLALSFTRDWLDMVLVHELAHVFHLDVRWRRLPWLRDLFGRVPLPYLFFPALGSPDWAVEGLATLVESEMTGAGRVHGTYHEMEIRTAVLEDAFPTIDRVTGETPLWPGAQRAYAYGSLFMDWLSHRFGERALRRVVDKTAEALIPPQVWFDRVGRSAFGFSFTEAYREWGRDLERRYRTLADSLGAAGLSDTEAPPLPRRWAFHPRISPDGGSLAYSLDDGREEPATALVDLGSMTVVRRWRRNGGGALLGPAAWLPDGGGLVTAQLELRGPYHLYSDLYLLGPDGEARLTRGLRLTDPAPHPHGGTVLAVQNGGGTNRLVSLDLESGEVAPLTSFDPDRAWALPRWSRDGSRIAAGLWRRGGLYDLVLLDETGALLMELTHDYAVDLAPAWSPDGRWLLFGSDRTGIPNIFAYDLRAAPGDEPLRQVTSLLTGAFFPEVSPDGRWVWFSAYHADGFRLERVPFEPSAWRPAPPPAPDFVPPDELAPPPSPAPPAAAVAARTAPLGGYSAWPTLRPHFWIPFAEPEAGPGEDRTAWGILTAGSDILGRHSFQVSALFEPEEKLVEGSAAYAWAGLGNPALGIAADRDWDFIARDTLDGGDTADLFTREDEVRVFATFRRPRWRTFLGLTLGAELVDQEVHIRNAPAGIGFGEGADPRDRELGIFGRVQLSTVQAQAFSISREDGVSLSIGARRRWEVRPEAIALGGEPVAAPETESGYWEATPSGAGYWSFPLIGFADHVLAIRGSGLWRHGDRAPTSSVGGASGLAEATLAGSFGSESLFLPARGFESGARRGTRAWSGTLEYRFPLALVGRGVRLWPLFLDRVSGAAFVDSADGWCSARQLVVRGGRGCSPATLSPLVSAGAELSLDVHLLYSVYLRVRGGVAVPIAGADTSLGIDDEPRFYVRLGPAF